MAQKKPQNTVRRNAKGVKAQKRKSEARGVSRMSPKSGRDRRLKNVAGKGAKKRKKTRSETSPDGGAAALAGFVNQMLGSAADFAVCISPKADDAGGFKTLILFETERYGQDSTSTGLS